MSEQEIKIKNSVRMLKDKEMFQNRNRKWRGKNKDQFRSLNIQPVVPGRELRKWEWWSLLKDRKISLKSVKIEKRLLLN